MCQQSRATVLICRVTMGYWKTCEGLQQQSAINNSMSQPGSGQPAIPSSGNRCFFRCLLGSICPTVLSCVVQVASFCHRDGDVSGKGPSTQFLRRGPAGVARLPTITRGRPVLSVLLLSQQRLPSPFHPICSIPGPTWDSFA
jgi:hypothetical protein